MQAASGRERDRCQAARPRRLDRLPASASRGGSGARRLLSNNEGVGTV